MKSYAATDVGQKRKINQDSIFESQMPVGNLPNLFIVADGMGGHRAGDYASRCAVRVITESILKSTEKNPVKLIGDAVSEANALIHDKSLESEELSGMGTTVVVTTILDGYAYTANVGDSRLYLKTDEVLTQITRDHSLVEEMVRIGQLTEEEARIHPDRHIITRALGASEEVDIDFFDYKIPPEGAILMCSDGLSNMVEDREIFRVLEEPLTVQGKVEKLIRTANDNGGRDNIAVIVVEPGNDEVK
ncbi:MAG: Stp1/IreP family PP2C-type Ser/Thr phosphatase [Lachnospiraceae bacterium]|nr:Stp1/IreP family PP2C-type Ser/Thr phosphatase [Lachnospiraceae bacterium]